MQVPSGPAPGAPLRWWHGWWRAGRPAGLPRLAASVALRRGASVHAVHWGGEELLVGCTDRQLTVLARRPLPAAGDRP